MRSVPRQVMIDDYRDDVLLCMPSTAREAAARNGDIPLTVVLAVLVPHYRGRGYSITETAALLGVSERTVLRQQCESGHRYNELVMA